MNPNQLWKISLPFSFSQFHFITTLYTLSFNWSSRKFETQLQRRIVADELEKDSALNGLTWEEAADNATKAYLRDGEHCCSPIWSYLQGSKEELNLGLTLV